MVPDTTITRGAESCAAAFSAANVVTVVGVAFPPPVVPFTPSAFTVAHPRSSSGHPFGSVEPPDPVEPALAAPPPPADPPLPAAPPPVPPAPACPPAPPDPPPACPPAPPVAPPVPPPAAP